MRVCMRRSSPTPLPHPFADLQIQKSIHRHKWCTSSPCSGGAEGVVHGVQHLQSRLWQVGGGVVAQATHMGRNEHRQ